MEAELRELIAKKDALETEIKQLNHKCEAIDQSKCKEIRACSLLQEPRGL